MWITNFQCYFKININNDYTALNLNLKVKKNHPCVMKTWRYTTENGLVLNFHDLSKRQK